SQRTRRHDLDVLELLAFTQTHDRALAELFVDLGQCSLQGLGFFAVGDDTGSLDLSIHQKFSLYINRLRCLIQCRYSQAGCLTSTLTRGIARSKRHFSSVCLTIKKCPPLASRRLFPTPPTLGASPTWVDCWATQCAASMRVCSASWRTTSKCRSRCRTWRRARKSAPPTSTSRGI